MLSFWRTRNGLSRVKLDISRIAKSLSIDIYETLTYYVDTIIGFIGLRQLAKDVAYRLGLMPSQKLVEKPNKTQPSLIQTNANSTSRETVKPVVFVSACANEHQHGGWKFNGGIKELNYLVKLLRMQGYEAYMVTYDGQYQPWLVEHQPHISLEEFRSKIKSLKSSQHVRCVTSWAIAKAFVQACDQIYFWDMELTLTEYSHFSTLSELYKKKIQNTAAISRTIQAWHMAHFQKNCILIPNLVDQSLWVPDEANRHAFRVGYMDEGSHTAGYIDLIKEALVSSNIALEFQLIKGDEAEIISSMQSCEVFLGMNIGKDVLWGEGCPRTHIEALSAGCVVIAFDIIGNRETIQSGFNGILVPRYHPELMAEALVNLYKTPGRIEYLRDNARSLLSACHTFDSRWTAVKEFLQLDTSEPSIWELEAKRSISETCRFLQKIR